MKFLLIFFLSSIFNLSESDEIIKDSNGNYFLMKENGTFKKLPTPKPGNKYVIKKKIIKTKKDKKIFKRPEKKSRQRTNQGFK